MRRTRRWLLAVLATTLGAVLLPSPAAAAGPGFTMVASGLDNPRGIAFFQGKLYVGEAGHGGTTCFDIGAPFKACVGDSSQISWVNPTTGAHGPLVSHLESVSLGPEGAIGVSGLSAADDTLLAQIGGTSMELPPTFTLGQKEAGRLISVRGDGSWRSIANVGSTDFNYTLSFTEPSPACGQCPGRQEHDSNPYGVLATEEGALVADAGSNTLDFVNGDGHIQVRLHDGFRDPNPATAFPTDAVPTCVARGKDSLWVGELSGRLLKVDGDSFTAVSNPLLSHVTGCTSDGEGNIYFVNMFGSGPAFTPPPASNFFIGNIVKFNTATGKSSVLVPALPFPNMDTIGPDGNLYVTVNSICPTAVPPLSFACHGATGGVVKIALPPGGGD